jgi:hypothetical protein
MFHRWLPPPLGAHIRLTHPGHSPRNFFLSLKPVEVAVVPDGEHDA